MTTATEEIVRLSPELKAQWVTALRSGDYQQGRAKLRFRATREKVDRYCCLGVLCDLIDPEGWEETGMNPGWHIDVQRGEQASHAETTMYITEDVLAMDLQRVFCGANDARGMSFADIADGIESGELDC